MAQEIGKHCSFAGCRQLDFLPFTCDACKRVYCLEHRSFGAHQCSLDLAQKGVMPQCPICSKYVRVNAEQTPDAVMDIHIRSGCKSNLLEKSAEEKKNFSSAKHCNKKGCKNSENFDTVKCIKCGKQHCLTHRHAEDHDCEVALPKGRKQPNSAASRLLANIASKKGSAEDKTKKKLPNEQLKRTQVKMRAKGDDSIKEEDRFFLEVYFPTESIHGQPMKIEPQSVWLNRQWTVGRVIEHICDRCSLENRNNEKNMKKLQLFSQRTQAALPVDVSLELFEPELMSGDSVFFKYV